MSAFKLIGKTGFSIPKPAPLQAPTPTVAPPAPSPPIQLITPITAPFIPREAIDRLPVGSRAFDPKQGSPSAPPSKTEGDPITRIERLEPPVAPLPVEGVLGKPAPFFEQVFGRLHPSGGGTEHERNADTLTVTTATQDALKRAGPVAILDPSKPSGLDYARSIRYRPGSPDGSEVYMADTDPLDDTYASGERLAMPAGTTAAIAVQARQAAIRGPSATVPASDPRPVSMTQMGPSSSGSALFLVIAAALAFLVLRR